MMMIDASALVAVLAGEPEAGAFAWAIAKADGCGTHPLSLWETVVALAKINAVAVLDAETAARRYLAENDVAIVATDAADASAAIEAFARYGKGRGHPAQLNMADCFSYAMAQRRGLPLLFKGEDFALTDVARAAL